MTFVDVSKVVKAEAQLRTLVDELNHRVRNTLQVVTAVATQTLREEPAPPAFVQTFIGRLRALGVAHELVSRGGWSDVPLHDLVAKDLEPYATTPDRVSVEGLPLRVSAKAAIALGMAVHELATNAAKHGSLSAAGGRVVIAWSVEGQAPDTQLLLRWREEDGRRCMRRCDAVSDRT